MPERHVLRGPERDGASLVPSGLLLRWTKRHDGHALSCWYVFDSRQCDVVDDVHHVHAGFHLIRHRGILTIHVLRLSDRLLLPERNLAVRLPDGLVQRVRESVE